jgi:putative tricarboxylic transport membrane protein
MLAAFVQFGIQPGPLLFANEGPLVWALIASLFIGNLLLLLVNLPLAPVWAKLLRLPRPYLYAGILFFATLGAYAVNLQAFDLAILLVLGALGFMMRRYGLPVLPLILGLILGPRAEGQLRKTLQLSAGDVSGLWSEPIAVVVYIIIALVLAWPLLAKLWRRLRPRTAGLVMAGGPSDDRPAAEPAAAPPVADPEAGSYLSPAVEAPAAERRADAGHRRADATHANHGQENP